MKSFKTKILFYLLLVLLMTVGGCGGSENGGISEGVIKYEITYPYYKDKFMLSMMPAEMRMEFKGNRYKNTVDNSMFGSSLISNCKDSSLVMLLHFGQKKIYSELDVALTDTMINRNGVPDIIALNATDSLAGLLCEKYMGVFEKLEDGYDCEVFEAKGIALKNSNWCNPYRGIDGVLLGYEIDQYGLQMRFKAFEVEETSVNDSIFNVPSNYKKVSLERMLYEVEEIFKNLL